MIEHPCKETVWCPSDTILGSGYPPYYPPDPRETCEEMQFCPSGVDLATSAPGDMYSAVAWYDEKGIEGWNGDTPDFWRNRGTGGATYDLTEVHSAVKVSLVNGMKTARFTGTSAWMRPAAAISVTRPFTVVAMVNAEYYAGADSRYLFDKYNPPTGATDRVAGWHTGPISGWRTIIGNSFLFDSTDTRTGLIFLAYRYPAISSTTAYIDVDYVKYTGVVAATGNFAFMTLGQRNEPFAGSRGLEGSVCEFAVFNGQLSDVSIGNIRDYMIAKWKLPLPEFLKKSVALYNPYSIAAGPVWNNLGSGGDTYKLDKYGNCTISPYYGLSMIRSDGVIGSIMKTAAAQETQQPFTVFHLFKADGAWPGGTTGDYVFDGHSGSANKTGLYRRTSDSALVLSSGSEIVVKATSALSTPYAIAIAANGASSRTRVNYDTVQTGSIDNVYSALSVAQFSDGGNAVNKGLNGSTGFHAVVPSFASDDEMAEVNRYARRLFGIENS